MIGEEGRPLAELQEELQPGKIGLEFDVLFFGPAHSNESRDCERHFADGDLAAQEGRSRNLLFTQKANPTLTDVLNPAGDRQSADALVLNRQALLRFDVQYVRKPRMPPAIGFSRSLHQMLMITRAASGVKSSNGLVQ